MANSSSAWGYLKIISTDKEAILKTIYLFDKYIKQYGYHTTLSDTDIYKEEELKSFESFKESRSKELYEQMDILTFIDDNGDDEVIKDELRKYMKVDDLPEMHTFYSNFYGEGRYYFMTNLNNFNYWLENELNPDTESDYYKRHKEENDKHLPEIKKDFKLYEELKSSNTYVYYDFTDEEQANMVLYIAKVLHHLNGDFIYEAENDLDYTRDNLIKYADYDPHEYFDLSKEAVNDFFDLYFDDSAEFSDLKFLKDTGRLEYFKRVLAKDASKLDSYGILYYDQMAELMEETFRTFRQNYKFLPKEMRNKINIVGYSVTKEPVSMTIEEVKNYFQDNYRYHNNDYEDALAEGYDVYSFKGSFDLNKNSSVYFTIKELRIGENKDYGYGLEIKFDEFLFKNKNGVKDLTKIIQAKDIKYKVLQLASTIRYVREYPDSKRWYIHQFEDLLDTINLYLVVEKKDSIL